MDREGHAEATNCRFHCWRGAAIFLVEGKFLYEIKHRLAVLSRVCIAGPGGCDATPQLLAAMILSATTWNKYGRGNRKHEKPNKTG